ncbi:MAG: alpha/beta hydrolase [Burkholderiales bacterium]|nr:MAG: alpha/beta hydrolase [Burkholderiales bacterium]
MADVIPKEEFLDGAGGVKIFIRSWRPASSPRGVIVISHGFNSHSGQYAWAAQQFVTKGFAVYAADLRGRGKSEGERFFVSKIDEYLGDVDLAVKLAKAREPDLPVFMLGHSAGGVIACTWALAHQTELAGLICESFAYRVPAPELALDTISWIGTWAPKLGVLKLKNAHFTRDGATLATLNADPLITNETQPAATVRALWQADKHLKASFPKLNLPVLILHGSLDKATVPAGSQFFHDTAGSKDKTLKIYDGHFHDLLADTGKEGVMADIQAWINGHMSG